MNTNTHQLWKQARLLRSPEHGARRAPNVGPGDDVPLLTKDAHIEGG